MIDKRDLQPVNLLLLSYWSTESLLEMIVWFLKTRDSSWGYDTDPLARQRWLSWWWRPIRLLLHWSTTAGDIRTTEIWSVDIQSQIKSMDSGTTAPPAGPEVMERFLVNVTSQCDVTLADKVRPSSPIQTLRLICALIWKHFLGKWEDAQFWPIIKSLPHLLNK